MHLLILKRFYLPFFSVLGLTIYMAQKLMFPLPLFANNYLNDLLCMPIVLKLCQYAIRFIKKDKHIVIPIKISFTLTVLYAIYFELLLPKFTNRYTADFIDVILYFIGLLFYIWIENMPIRNRLDAMDNGVTSL